MTTLPFMNVNVKLLMKMKNKSLLFNNKYFNYILNYPYLYITLLFFIFNVIPILINLFSGKPLFISGESYYHLYFAQEVTWQTFYYYPLNLLDKLLSVNLMIIVPLLLSLTSLYLYLWLAKKKNFSLELTMLFLTILIISPSIFFNLTNLSIHLLIVLLTICGFLLLCKESRLRYFSLIPFILATVFDLTSSIVIILLLSAEIYFNKRKNYAILIITFIAVLINAIIFKLPFVIGPFYLGKHLPELISDFGGLGGISFFTVLLALIGIGTMWKKRSFISAYFFLLFTIIAFIINIQALFYLVITLSFFAAVGIKSIFQRKWTLNSLKKFTFFIVTLGLIFSTLAYLDRIDEFGPSKEDQQLLTLMEEELEGTVEDEDKIFSLPEESYFVSYFSNRDSFYYPHYKKDYRENVNLIISSTNIMNTFPILEGNDVNVIYISEHSKRTLPSENGLLFLLRNERFKLIQSSGNAEVWIFK
jgi:hypothetical protein